MKQSKSIKIVVVVIEVLLVLGMYFYGQNGPSPFKSINLAILVLTIPLPVIVFFNRVYLKVAAGLVHILLMFGMFFLGFQVHSRAFNSCFFEGEYVRYVLSDYKKKHREYPVTLEEIGVGGLCSRPLTGTILKYEKTEDGFELSFRDWLYEHVATEKGTFKGNK